MIYINLVLAMGALATAAPLVQGGLNSTVWTPGHVLQADEVILYGSGRMEIVHKSVYHALMEAQGVARSAPEIEVASFVNTTNEDSILEKRQCNNNAVITDTNSYFQDWDLQMSPVVRGVGTNGIDVFVSSGYSASNTITVTASAEYTFILNTLSATTGIQYARSWGTQTVINLRGNVPDGFSGVMITQPWTTRRTGRHLRGCLGAMRTIGTFQADSHEPSSYEGVSWISGSITMCVKREHPLSRCNGGGNFR